MVTAAASGIAENGLWSLLIEPLSGVAEGGRKQNWSEWVRRKGNSWKSSLLLVSIDQRARPIGETHIPIQTSEFRPETLECH
jgi:hypothetical protein